MVPQATRSSISNMMPISTHCNMRALHNSYFLKEDGLFFSSKALGLVFSATYLRGNFAPSALPR
jgi:hypothetical protein